jgi:hypothetical protein
VMAKGLCLPQSSPCQGGWGPSALAINSQLKLAESLHEHKRRCRKYSPLTASHSLFASESAPVNPSCTLPVVVADMYAYTVVSLDA